MYQRTVAGEQEIRERHLQLSSRIRTLLLLIESYDLNKLDQKIAASENFDKLLELGLIVKIEQTENTTSLPEDATQPQQTSLLNRVATLFVKKEEKQFSIETQETYELNKTVAITHTEPELEPITTLGFIELKSLMRDTLKQYCGLMAKHLIIAIEQAQTTEELRDHQKKWLTSLFETRISRAQLNHLLKVINHNMQRLDLVS